MQRLLILSCGLLAAAVVFLCGSPCRAADGGAASYVGSDVVNVAMLDLTKIDVVGTVEQAARLGLVPEAEVAVAREKAAAIQKAFSELPSLGARRVYVLLRTSDIQAGGPTVVIETEGAGAAGRVADWVKSMLAAAGKDDLWKLSPEPIDAPPKVVLAAMLSQAGDVLPTHVEAADDVVLCTRTPQQMAALKAAHNGPRRADAQAALAALAKSDAGVMAIGDPDTRRVIREMFPVLPAPFAEIDGRLVADGVAWIAVTLKLPPDPTISLTIEATTKDVAATLEQTVTKGIDILKGLCMAATVSGSPEAAAGLPVLALLKPQVEGNRLSLTFGDDKAELDAVESLLIPALAKARVGGARPRMNNLKQLALAMFNYHDAKGSFPPVAIYGGAEGKPLLSWRVAILPYLEQDALYKEFHLNEPWDSEHNRKLIDRMPAVYATPNPSAPMAPGRTTLVVPVGEATVFHGAEGTKISDIKDGTSKTIMIVDIPTQAVVWTKPEDWEVDFKFPLPVVECPQGSKERGGFAAAFCDGSVQWIITDAMDATNFAGLLTRDGGENVSR